MEWRHDEFTINDDLARVNLEVVNALLAQSYWAAGRQPETMKRAAEGSLCFNLYHNERQVGFARVVTDRATFAWICDVIIHPDYRGRGLGKWLMECLLSHPAVQGTQQILKTRDAHGLYERYGFEPDNCMRRRG